MTEEDSGAASPAGASLPDRIALGVLTRLVTRELVEDVIARTGRREERRWLLPARVTVYFVLALGLLGRELTCSAATVAVDSRHR